MIHRSLGPKLLVSAIGIGCMPMSGSKRVNYGPADRAEAIATIHEAIALGVTFFDTAEAYGAFANETLVGAAVHGQRHGLILATKFAYAFDEAGRTDGKPDGSPANVRRAIEGSLRRLGTDVVDLFYQHRVDPAVPIEETVGAMARLVDEGKVRFLGLSEASAATVRRAAAVHPIAALQSEYSLWERGVEAEILPTCRELNIGFVPYSPLGRGFLAGAIRRRADLGPDDYRLRDPRFASENFDTNIRALAVIEGVAASHGVSPAQVALAWLLARGDDIVPIPGTRRRETMQDSMAASSLRLSSADLHALDEINAAGARYGDAEMRSIDAT